MQWSRCFGDSSLILKEKLDICSGLFLTSYARSLVIDIFFADSEILLIEILWLPIDLEKKFQVKRFI
jgi:hypothetical protein